MRINTSVKIHELHGPRLPYNPKLAEIRENEYAYLTADGIAVLDGEGILYWVDSIITTDGGDVLVYDNNAASGKILAGAYAAKKPFGVSNTWNPPKNYKHGIFVDLNNAAVEICYKPIARNLRCTVAVVYGPGTKNLVCKVDVVYIAGSKNLVSRVTVVYTAGAKDLVSRITVVYAQGSKNVVVQATVLRESSKDLTGRVNIVTGGGTSNMVSRVTVRKEASRNLVCKLYADRTP